jgi:hypothetical protein
MALQSPDHLAFQMWLAWSKKTRWLRDFCVIQWCFVVLLDEFATDIPRAWLLKINYMRISKFPIFPSLRASNRLLGLQLNHAHEPELSILGDVLIACRQCRALCRSGRDQEGSGTQVRRVARPVARLDFTSARQKSHSQLS